MSGEEISGVLGGVAKIIAALGFVVLVFFLTIPLRKLGKLLDEARNSVKNLSDETVPLIGEVTTTVGHTNHQLQKVDTITTKVGVISDNGVQVATNISALTALFAATLGSPVIRVAAFTYGVRHAMSGRKTGATRGRRRKKV